VIRPMRRGEEVACEAILRALPEWFGIEESLVGHVRDCMALQTSVVDVDGVVVGFLTLEPLGPRSAEIRAVAVAPEHHGRGYGRLLVEHAECALLGRSVDTLQVKTLSSSDPDPSYRRTRGFYEHLGFRPLRETLEWGEASPCVVMVKHLRCAST